MQYLLHFTYSITPPPHIQTMITYWSLTVWRVVRTCLGVITTAPSDLNKSMFIAHQQKNLTNLSISVFLSATYQWRDSLLLKTTHLCDHKMIIWKWWKKVLITSCIRSYGHTECIRKARGTSQFSSLSLTSSHNSASTHRKRSARSSKR